MKAVNKVQPPKSKPALSSGRFKLHSRVCFLVLGIWYLTFGAYSLTFAQRSDSTTDHVNKKRLRTVVISSAVAYSATLAGLSQLWYKDSERQSFQFFNDNHEWKQVDKLGHFYSSFYISYGASKTLQWSGLSAKKSDLIGAFTGFLMLLPIEILDGFSNAYGASTGDILANASGSSFYLLQAHLWKEVRIFPKFSFHSSDYAALRPELLGKGLSEEIVKDYNGQTYWLSVDVDKFIKFPRWLNLAAGYSANGMIYARDEENRNAGYHPYRQYYLSVDFDLKAIRTRSKTLRTIFFIMSAVKIPAPALEFSKHGTTVHAFYF